MNRETALNLLQQHLTSEHLIGHSLAVAAIMEGVAEHFAVPAENFVLAGLLHDIDYDQTLEDPDNHALIGAEILAQNGLPESVIYAVKAHNYRHGLARNDLLSQALFAADPTSGFITAAALIRPEKKLEFVELKSLQKRFKEKAFAKGANREYIATCSEMGLPLDEFLAISLNSMKKYADELGL